jgi:hypothetical protein
MTRIQANDKANNMSKKVIDRDRLNRLVDKLRLNDDLEGAVTTISAELWDNGQNPYQILHEVVQAINKKFRWTFN